MTRLKKEILKDIARLTNKYKDNDWEELGIFLRDPEQLASLQILLVQLAETSRNQRRAPNRKRGKSSGTHKIREALASIRKEDPERADLLEGIWAKLRQRELLPTMAAVRTFAEAMGSKGLRSSRRDQAVAELMELFLQLPEHTLEEKMRQTVVEERQLGDEYEAWVDLILHRSRKDRPPDATPSPSK